jgi:hypothetical protein
VTDFNNVNIIATSEFTASALTLMNDLRVLSTTVTEWTASAGKINYLHVGEWYFSGSFSQSRKPGGTVLQSKPQTEGYEVVCGQGRGAQWAYHTNNPFALASQANITRSIKATRGVNFTHTQAAGGGGEGQ